MVKVFERVHVERLFRGRHYHRHFDLMQIKVSITTGRLNLTLHIINNNILINMKDIYRQHARKNIETIAKDILNHCLWYYIRLRAPSIKVKDEETKLT